MICISQTVCHLELKGFIYKINRKLEEKEKKKVMNSYIKHTWSLKIVLYSI